ncbi:MAG: hypothetical protein U0R19_40470 [Bryobacteraceae bacterium]
MVRFEVLWIFFLFAVSGAGNASGNLEERIDDAVNRISADTCFAQADPSLCEWGEYGLGPEHFDMAVSTGEAILIIDEFGDGVLPQFVRYRNRLLGIYQVNGQTVEAQQLAVRLPKQLGDALVSFAGPEFIPASRLARVSEAAGYAYSKVPLLFLGHGGIVFSHLVELAPEQPLVILNIKGVTGLLPSLCERIDDETLGAAAEHFTGIASSLKELMNRHNVRFVNFSIGDSTQTMATDWSRTCGTGVPNAEVRRRLLHLYDPIYDVLFHTEGVATAHAAANLSNPDDFPFDQARPLYPNRVRVGFISSLRSGLDEVGRGTVQKADQFPGNNSDADLFVNWGCELFRGCADSHYEFAGAFGLGAYAMPIMSTSYVNPLGLGRLIHLRYGSHSEEPMSNALIQALREELTPSLCGADGAQPCVYQDPILHRQLEIYRRGYR